MVIGRATSIFSLLYGIGFDDSRYVVVLSGYHDHRSYAGSAVQSVSAPSLAVLIWPQYQNFTDDKDGES